MITVLTGGIRHELHSFVPGRFTLADFERQGILRGDEVLEEIAGNEYEGALAAAAERDVRFIPTIMSSVGAGPVVDDDAYLAMIAPILDGAREHRNEIDGIYLRLHGAMTTTARTDPEGDLVAALREIVDDLPIAASFDLHTHMTDQLAARTDIIVGYETCPHVDYFETGERSIHLLADAVAGRTRPVTAHRKIRLMASSEAHDTAGGPLTPMQARARAIEAEPGVLKVSIFATQPWMDVPDAGWSVTVTTDGDIEAGQRHADVLARALWEHRDAYHVSKTPIAHALARAVERRDEPGPVVVSDCADSPSAGASGDGTSLLAALIGDRSDLEALLVVTDAAAAEAAHHAGVGATIEVELGGQLTPEFFSPLAVRAQVAQLDDRPYASIHPPKTIFPGLSAVLSIDPAITVIVVSDKVPQKDLHPFTRWGIDPLAYELVQVKSAGGYRADWEPVAKEIFDLDTTGPCDSDLTRLPFARITRPLWPFDPDLAQPWAGA